MQRYTEKVHTERGEPEVVWIKREPDAKAAKQSLSTTETDETTDAEDVRRLPIVYSREYGVHFAKLEKLHPFDAQKGKHISKLLVDYKLLQPGHFYEPRELTKTDLLKVHKTKYLRSLKWSLNVAQIAEIPILLFVPNCWVQRGYLRPMRFQAAGSIMAGKLALQNGWAINLGGGFHHCCSYKGGGFCPYADITLLIQRTMEEEPGQVQHVMIVDLDAHQGNGHERDFLNKPNVYILDMYNYCIYPKDHEAKLAIRYAVELKPRTGNSEYMQKLKKGLQCALKEFRPNLVVYNAGTDILQGDPLGYLSITPEGVMKRDEFVFATCRLRNIPIVMLLSGGYLKASAKVIADSINNLKQQGLLKIND